MTTLTIILAVTLVSFATNYLKNPINLSLALILISTAILSQMQVESGPSWFPTIIYLIFLGGILIMFIILSALLPNESSIKIRIPTIVAGATVLAAGATINGVNIQTQNFQGTANKMISCESLNLLAMLLIITIYFLGFIFILSNQSTPMRSIICFNTSIL